MSRDALMAVVARGQSTESCPGGVRTRRVPHATKEQP
jgi:hypothetical protein